MLKPKICLSTTHCHRKSRCIIALVSGDHVLVLYSYKKVKAAHTRLLSVGFRSWSRFLAVSPQVTLVINPAVGCHCFPPGPQLPLQPLRGLLPFSLLGEQRHDGWEQFAKNCYPTVSRLRFEPRPFCASCTLTSGISWAICKSAPRSRQITMPASHHSVFLQARCPSCRSNQQCQSTEGTYCPTRIYIIIMRR